MDKKQFAVLIVEANPVIAVDVAETVCEVLGDCHIVNVGDAEAALEALDTDGSFNLTILCLSPSAISSTKLDTALIARRLPVVIVSDDFNAELVATLWPKWGFVCSPFATFDLTEAIAHASVGGMGCPKGTSTAAMS